MQGMLCILWNSLGIFCMLCILLTPFQGTSMYNFHLYLSLPLLLFTATQLSISVMFTCTYFSKSKSNMIQLCGPWGTPKNTLWDKQKLNQVDGFITKCIWLSYGIFQINLSINSIWKRKHVERMRDTNCKLRKCILLSRVRCPDIWTKVLVFSLFSIERSIVNNRRRVWTLKCHSLKLFCLLISVQYRVWLEQCVLMVNQQQNI